jgi:hypothetical protein
MRKPLKHRTIIRKVLLSQKNINKPDHLIKGLLMQKRFRLKIDANRAMQVNPLKY